MSVQHRNGADIPKFEYVQGLNARCRFDSPSSKEQVFMSKSGYIEEETRRR